MQFGQFRRNRLPEPRRFDFRIGNILIRNPLQRRRRKHHHGFAQRHAGSAGHPLQKEGFGRGAVIDPGQRLPDFGLSDAAGQLRRQRHQKGFFIVAVLALVALLRRQHAQHLAPAQDRRADKTVERRFASRSDIAERGMSRRIVDIDRLRPAGDQSDQSLADFQSHLADCASAQTIGRHQHMLAPDRIGHVYRADIGMQRGLDFGHNEMESLVQIAGSVDVFNDAAQGIQHGTILHRQATQRARSASGRVA